MYCCEVERDCPQADSDEPAGDWATCHDSARNIIFQKDIAKTMVRENTFLWPFFVVDVVVVF